jgi:hypothetical protein
LGSINDRILPPNNDRILPPNSFSWPSLCKQLNLHQLPLSPICQSRYKWAPSAKNNPGKIVSVSHESETRIRKEQIQAEGTLLLLAGLHAFLALGRLRFGGCVNPLIGGICYGNLFSFFPLAVSIF